MWSLFLLVVSRFCRWCCLRMGLLVLMVVISVMMFGGEILNFLRFRMFMCLEFENLGLRFLSIC